MATCPVKSHPDWGKLVASRGETMAFYLWDKYEGNVPESESRQEIVKAGLKATSILQSDKAIGLFNTLTKNKVTGDAFWKKIQNDLAIPKEQINILKSFNTTDREELLTSLLANYSYTVEVKTAGNIEGDLRYSDFARDGDLFTDEELQKEGEFTPSSYYSNLTVPGGTNYTENRIITPQITPSIKGHPQFAEDNDIGWHRADDRSWDVKAALNYLIESGQIEKQC